MPAASFLPRRTIALVVACAIAACGESVEPREPVTAVEVTPPTATLGVGATLPIAARVIGTGGEELGDRELFWNTSDSAVALVDGNGVVTAVSSGTAQIAASSEGKSGIVAVTVVPTPVSSVVVLPTQLTIGVAATSRIQAQTLDANGLPLTGRPVLWASGTEQVATVDDAGVVTGVSVGSATITAASEGKSATAQVTVTPGAPATLTISPSSLAIGIGGTGQFTATVRDVSGAVIPGAPVTWSISGGAASISANGLVTGLAGGTSTVTATSGSASSTATVIVSAAPPPVASVVVVPSAPSVNVGATVQLTASTFDASGNLLTGRVVSWSTSNALVASVSSTGLVTGLLPGTATITATSEGQSGTATVTVVLAGGARLIIVSGDGQVANRGKKLPNPLVVRVEDAAGNGVANLTVSWAVTSGGGKVSASSTKTDRQGYSHVDFTLGNGKGTQQVTATVSGVGQVTFTAIAQ